MPLFTHGQRPAGRALVRAVFPLLRIGMRQSMRINAEAAERSRVKTEQAMDRLEEEIGPSGYLVGDRFTVADLTAAALFYPVAQPEEFPYPSIEHPPPSAREFLDPLRDRRGGEWVADIYRRHRSPGTGAEPGRAEAAPSPAASPDS